MYFVNMVFKGAKTCYQKIEKASARYRCHREKVVTLFLGTQNPCQYQLSCLIGPEKTRSSGNNGILGGRTLSV